MKKVRLSSKDLKRIINIVSEQVNGEYYDITPEKYLELMNYASYNGNGVTSLKMFQGKPLRITGSLKISNTPTKSLGNVAVIDGDLDISSTNIMSVDDIDISGSVRDWDSGVSRKRAREIAARKNAEADSRREDNEWSLSNEDIDEEGLRANALYEYLVNQGDFEEFSDEDKEEVRRIKNLINSLNTEYEEEDDPELADAIYDQISELEEEMDEILDGKEDIYTLYPSQYGGPGGLTMFEVLGSDSEYSVGTEEEMEDAAKEDIRNLFDDIGVEGFRENFLEDYIDIDYLAKYFEDGFYDDVRENPESYFDDDDYELTEEQEERIEELEAKISEYEEEQSKYDYSDDEYDEYQELIDELQEELDEIVPDTEPTEEMIENVVESRLDELRRYPMSYIKDWGLDIKNFIDEDELVEGVYQSDGFDGILRYDGNYDIVEINGVDYYVFRVN